MNLVSNILEFQISRLCVHSKLIYDTVLKRKQSQRFYRFQKSFYPLLNSEKFKHQEISVLSLTVYLYSDSTSFLPNFCRRRFLLKLSFVYLPSSNRKQKSQFVWSSGKRRKENHSINFTKVREILLAKRAEKIKNEEFPLYTSFWFHLLHFPQPPYSLPVYIPIAEMKNKFSCGSYFTANGAFHDFCTL